MCVGAHIQSKGRFQKTPVIDTGKIPGLIIDSHALPRDGIDDFENLFENSDCPIFINAAATFHHKQALNIVYFSFQKRFFSS